MNNSEGRGCNSIGYCGKRFVEGPTTFDLTWVSQTEVTTAMSTTLSATTSPRRSGDEGCRGAKRAIASKEGNSRATKKKNDASRVNDGSGRKLQRHWRRFGLVDVEVSDLCWCCYDLCDQCCPDTENGYRYNTWTQTRKYS